jgi:redox-sensitive bicupin YhaK (pirin superfamily)
MKFRSIQKKIKASRVNMGGLPVDQHLPYPGLDQVDPFLLIHHATARYLSGSHPRDVGVGPHPHRGFSPVTLVFQGEVHHRDSRGHSSIVQAGGVQWMNSGLGIVHSERPSKALAEQGGVMEIVQFWVNTPRKKKMAVPSYLPLQQNEIPVLDKSDDGLRVMTIAGTFEGVSGKVETYSPMLVLRIDMEAGAEKMFAVPEHFNMLVYTLRGEVKVNDTEAVYSKDMVVFNKDGEGFSLKAQQKTIALVLAGEPLNEKVVSHGPFVMNSDTEILQAMRDYQQGRMGVLIEEFD